MRKGTLIQTAIWAVGTCGLTLALVGPSHLQADGPEEKTPAAVLQQKPMTDPATGAVISVAFADKDAKAEAGKPLPAMNLIATAPADKDVTLKVKYVLNERMIPSPWQRSPAFPQPVTSDTQEFVLKAGQTQTVALALKLDLKMGYSYDVQLTTGDNTDAMQVQSAMAIELRDPNLDEMGRPIKASAQGKSAAYPPGSKPVNIAQDSATPPTMPPAPFAANDISSRNQVASSDVEVVPETSVIATQPSTQPVDPPKSKSGKSASSVSKSGPVSYAE